MFVTRIRKIIDLQIKNNFWEMIIKRWFSNFEICFDLKKYVFQKSVKSRFQHFDFLTIQQEQSLISKNNLFCKKSSSKSWFSDFEIFNIKICFSKIDENMILELWFFGKVFDIKHLSFENRKKTWFQRLDLLSQE